MKRGVATVAAAALLLPACGVVGPSGGCDGTEVVGVFEQVGDLVARSNVQSSDVVIGTVTDIELDRERWLARVSMCIEENERIPADTEAVIRTTSLLGEKFVDLRPRSSGPPYLEDGDYIGVSATSKATELEDVFTRLAAVLGAGNLEQINRFTAAQARILRDNSGELRMVLRRLSRFTGILAARKEDIATAVDSLDAAARTLLADDDVLRRFLRSFAESSEVLAEQRNSLEDLLVALDRFTNVSVQLLDETERGLNEQFDKLRPVLRTAVENSRNVAATLRTLATFAEWFPESMPGDYLQLDVCQAPPEEFGQGTTCAQAKAHDDPSGSLERILLDPFIAGGRR